jgi:hypothetical protein
VDADCHMDPDSDDAADCQEDTLGPADSTMFCCSICDTVDSELAQRNK